MTKHFSWIMRAAFGACLIYAYFGVCRTSTFTFKAYNFLFINLTLAYIPAEIALHIKAKSRSVVFWPLFTLWLLFYPNAPYMLTDFFHLAQFDPYIIAESGRRTSLIMPDIAMWAAFTILSVGIFVAAFFGVWGLERVTDALLERLGTKRLLLVKFAMVVAISACAGAGIYLGRFPRLHTIDLFTRPIWALGRIVDSLGVGFLQFSALMTALQTVFWALAKGIWSKSSPR